MYYSRTKLNNEYDYKTNSIPEVWSQVGEAAASSLPKDFPLHPQVWPRPQAFDASLNCRGAISVWSVIYASFN